jgi:catechol 2,3-dioxygenase-like lactoylglutathione lyase family enzyme
MLANAHITTILPAVDLERARRFYRDKLGLAEAGSTAQGGIVFEAGDGTDIELMRRDTPTRAEHTAVTFEVTDLEDELRQLQRNGITFEDYDLPGLKTERHIAVIGSEKAAWFKDPEGNILCLHQSAPV